MPKLYSGHNSLRLQEVTYGIDGRASFESEWETWRLSMPLQNWKDMGEPTVIRVRAYHGQAAILHEPVIVP